MTYMQNYEPVKTRFKYALLNVGRNHKTIKGDKKGNYVTGILYLASGTSSGYNVCPKSTPGCRKACLNYVGYGNFEHVQKARIAKTRHFFQNQRHFLNTLVEDIRLLIHEAGQLNAKPAVRLNGTSDILWERITVGPFRNLMEMFPYVQFYDYTKIPNRQNLPKNYHLTYSFSEENEKDHHQARQNGWNVAYVFRNQVPDAFDGYQVINGDSDDLRFLDPKNVIVGLKTKGVVAKNDTTGFVQEGDLYNAL